MIVPMSKVYVVARHRDRQHVLDTLRDLGLVHLAPVSPETAQPDEAISREVETLRKALPIVAGVQPEGTTPNLSPMDAAHEAVEIRRRSIESGNQLSALYRQLEQIGVWSGLRLADIEVLEQAGVHVQFVAVPAEQVGGLQAECVAKVRELPDGEMMVALANRGTRPSVPEAAAPLPLPPRDSHMIAEEAKEIDEALRRDIQRLQQLALLSEPMQQELARLEERLEESVAIRGAVIDEHLVALQGWMPKDQVSELTRALEKRDIAAAVETLHPEEDEHPPTLIQPPAWTRPIEGLFRILGTVPGYREFDVSTPFLIALPIFTAMLISDAGYGAIILLASALGYSWAAKKLGPQFVQLLIIVGAVSVVWGALTNAFFGFQFLPVTLIPVDLTEDSRVFMMRLSFVIGAVHLSLAQLWQAVRYWPNLQALCRVGWAIFIWGMFGVTCHYVLQAPFGWDTPWPFLLIVGAALAITFAAPRRNIFARFGLGLAAFPLAMLSAFSDVISYVRLMAVGLASSVLAVSFNDMAFDAGLLPLTILILVFGHALNLGLALIAMFAHGVRLNMLEFGSNLGMQWTGYPFKPFARRTAWLD